MSKIAFIGDSFSAYKQAGQFENHWSWKLAQKYPQHTYINYATGGIGHNYYQYALLDAKMNGVDIVFVSRTYNHRVGFLINDYEFKFNKEALTDNYTLACLQGDRYVYYCGSSVSGAKHFLQRSSTFLNLSKSLNQKIVDILQNKSVSLTSQQYNDKWFDNIKDLYNFKHIIPLELMNIIDDNAFKQMASAHGVDNCEIDADMFNSGLIVSLTDNHLSPKGNDWVLENYILTLDTIKILE